MNNLCIIPARCGSKRIPKKNIKNFIGKPVISYSIKAALESCLFSEVMVSTDSEEIARISDSYGAKIPFLRSTLNSSDEATTASVLNEVLSYYKDIDKVYDNVLCLYPAAPLVSKLDIIDLYKKFIKKDLDAIFPVIKYSSPIFRSYSLKDGFLKMNNPEYRNTRTQDLKSAYYDAGQFYWFNAAIFSKNGDIITENCGGVEVSEASFQDIDNVIDWEIAELKYKHKYKIKS
jgi:pseudaminic acid cytidylyltransferase